MIQGVLQNTLITAGLFVSSLSPSYPPVASVTFYPGTDQDYVHVVKSGESFSSIANDYYHDSSLWTVIWEDNKFEGDPNSLEEGMKLVIRRGKPEQKQIASGFVQSIAIENTTETVTVTPAIQATSIPEIVQTTPAVRSGATGPLNDAQIAFLGNCESGMRADANTGNGFYGAFQFMIGTWNSMETGYARADMAPLEVQKAAVQRLLSRSSIWTQFPGCARKMQAAGLI